jgi:aspartate aminotransferase/aminotransferase
MPFDPGSLISGRARAVDSSGIRKVFDLAAKLSDPINLSIGLPDFDVPEAVKDAAAEAVRAGFNRYTPTQGISPLRDRLHSDLQQELSRDPGDVVITSGVSGGLYLSILALIDPGDEVLFLDPYFVMYRHLLTMAGGKSVAIDSYPHFRFDADQVERAITPRTKMLILNSPGNPTGVTLSHEEQQAAIRLCEKHNLILLSDEIYNDFRFGDAPPSPAAEYENTLLLRGFSKSHGMTGWRVAYVAGPSAIVQQMAKLQQYTYVCAPSPFQHAAVAAMDVDMSAHFAAYRHKRDLVVDALGGAFELTPPDGAFYAFPKAPAGMTGTDFCTQAVGRNVLVIPGGVFSDRDTHFRVSFAAPDDKLIEGCQILADLARNPVSHATQ